MTDQEKMANLEEQVKILSWIVLHTSLMVPPEGLNGSAYRRQINRLRTLRKERGYAG